MHWPVLIEPCIEMYTRLTRAKIRYSQSKCVVQHLLGGGMHDNIVYDEQESNGKTRYLMSQCDSVEKSTEGMMKIQCMRHR